MNRKKLKGLWIPAEILLNEELSDKEKIILSMIAYLSVETKSCFVSNKYIANIVNVADKYQKERDKILADNKIENIKKEYKTKEFDIEWKFKSKIKSLEKENNHLNKVVNRFYDTVEKFIKWVCKKFSIGESKD